LVAFGQRLNLGVGLHGNQRRSCHGGCDGEGFDQGFHIVFPLNVMCCAACQRYAYGSRGGAEWFKENRKISPGFAGFSILYNFTKVLGEIPPMKKNFVGHLTD